MTQPMKLLGISAGAVNGSVEILTTSALQSASAGTHAGTDVPTDVPTDVEVSLVRLVELDLPAVAPLDGRSDDSGWLWEQILEADGLIIGAPIFSRTIPAILKVVVDRLLGPNADRAIVQRQLDMLAAGQQPAMMFRADERVLKPRVAGLIAVGGALTPQWKALALPGMHMMTFSMQTAVVDQMLVGGAGTPQSVVLDDAALARARTLGTNVASQLGRPFDRAEYLGAPGLCPMCHLDVIQLQMDESGGVTCATCGATGVQRGDLSIEWTDLTTSVISMEDKAEHFEEIMSTAGAHAAQRDVISARAAELLGTVPVTRPGA